MVTAFFKGCIIRYLAMFEPGFAAHLLLIKDIIRSQKQFKLTLMIHRA